MAELKSTPNENEISRERLAELSRYEQHFVAQ